MRPICRSPSSCRPCARWYSLHRHHCRPRILATGLAFGCANRMTTMPRLRRRSHHRSTCCRSAATCCETGAEAPHRGDRGMRCRTNTGRTQAVDCIGRRCSGGGVCFLRIPAAQPCQPSQSSPAHGSTIAYAARGAQHRTAYGAGVLRSVVHRLPEFSAHDDAPRKALRRSNEFRGVQRRRPAECGACPPLVWMASRMSPSSTKSASSRRRWWARYRRLYSRATWPH